MEKCHETPGDRALGTLWSWTWPLLFVCAMMVLSEATQSYSGYAAAQIVEADSQPVNCQQ